MFNRTILAKFIAPISRQKNPKSEYRKRPRGPKQTGAKINPKPGKTKTSNPIWARLEIVVFFIILDLFRISDFEFRICKFAYVWLALPFDFAQGLGLIS